MQKPYIKNTGAPIKVPGYQIRAIEQEDHYSVVSLLQELSVYVPSEEDFPDIWNRFLVQSHVLGLVATTLDVEGQNTIIGYGSICLETKIRGGSMGHIEDVVVAPLYRGAGVGSSIVKRLVDFANNEGCYKVSLECRVDIQNFYENMGFCHTGSAMSMMPPSASTVNRKTKQSLRG